MTTPNLLVLLGVAFLAGCHGTSASVVPLSQLAAAPETVPETIELLMEPPTRPHQKLALVIASSKASKNTPTDRAEARAIAEAREEAGHMGADALLLGGQSRDALGSQGTAVGTTVYGTTIASGSSSSELTITVRALAIRYTDGGAKAELVPVEVKK